MNTQVKQQLGAYATHQQKTETVRETEARALLNCANRLVAAQDPKNGMEAYLDAIRQNQHLWTLFQVTLTEPDNPLPRDLKVILLNLSRFVDKVSLRASAEYNPSLLTSLVNINRQIAAGLSVASAAPAAGVSAAAGAASASSSSQAGAPQAGEAPARLGGTFA